MGYYSEVKILTSREGAMAAARASMTACKQQGNDYPILTLDEKRGLEVNRGKLKEVGDGGEAVILWWPCIKWYSDYASPSFADMRAIEEVVESGDYPMQLIRVGEQTDDIETKSAFDVSEIISALGLALEVCVSIDTFC